jgi:hypothetical protein
VSNLFRRERKSVILEGRKLFDGLRARGTAENARCNDNIRR